jgi:hypothetical protein
MHLQAHSVMLSRLPKGKVFSMSISMIGRFTIVEKFNRYGEIMILLSRVRLFDEIARGYLYRPHSYIGTCSVEQVCPTVTWRAISTRLFHPAGHHALKYWTVLSKRSRSRHFMKNDEDLSLSTWETSGKDTQYKIFEHPIQIILQHRWDASIGPNVINHLWTSTHAIFLFHGHQYLDRILDFCHQCITGDRDRSDSERMLPPSIHRPLGIDPKQL